MIDHPPSWTQEILDRLARIEARLNGQLPDPLKGLSTAEAMEITGHGSLSAFYAWARKWKLKPYASGHYRREDLRLAMARPVVVIHPRRKYTKRSPKWNPEQPSE